jgi:hypothetical protein
VSKRWIAAALVTVTAVSLSPVVDPAAASPRAAEAPAAAGTAAEPGPTATPPDAASAASTAPTQVWEWELPGWNRGSAPTIADLDMDGVNDIIFGHQDGLIRAIHADGTPVAGWPRGVYIGGTGPVAVDSAPTVADIDRDGVPEVIVPVGSTWVHGQHGGMAVFDNQGNLRWQYRSRDYGGQWDNRPSPDGYSEGMFSTPAIGDVDGDGYMDIVVGGWDLHIHAFDRNGNELPGFPFNNEDSQWSSPALYDVDGDGRQEIFIGADQTPGGIIDWAGGHLWALDHTGTGVNVLWRRDIAEVIDSSPAIGDIDGDGRVEIVVGTGDAYQGRGAQHTIDGQRVWAFNAEDGSNAPGWPQATEGIVWASPALGDLDGDGDLDVTVAARDGKVWAWRGDGSLLWSVRPNQQAPEVGGPMNASPIIADLDGDGGEDVAVGNSWGFFLFDGTTGARLTTPLGQWWSYEATAALGDFGPFGWRLIISGFDTPGRRSRMAAYQVTPPANPPDWPVWRLNARHLGARPSDGTPLPPGMCRAASNPASAPVTNSGSGYWVLRRNGVVEAFHSPHLGNAALSPGVTAVGMAARPQGDGYWIVGSDGAVYGMGAAPWLGAPNALGAGGRAVNIAPTPSGGGYWVIMADGRVFAFGDAGHHGDPSSMALNQPVIALASTPSGHGYWVLALDGGIFSYGDAAFYGSTGNLHLNAPVLSLTSTASGHGYWLMGRDGGIFSFGDAQFRGSAPGTGLCAYPDAVQIRRTLTGGGYWTLMVDNGVFSYGDANFFGANPDPSGTNPPVDLVIRN